MRSPSNSPLSPSPHGPPTSKFNVRVLSGISLLKLKLERPPSKDLTPLSSTSPRLRPGGRDPCRSSGLTDPVSLVPLLLPLPRLSLSLPRATTSDHSSSRKIPRSTTRAPPPSVTFQNSFRQCTVRGNKININK